MKKIAYVWLSILFLLAVSCAGIDSSRQDSSLLTESQIEKQINSFIEDWLNMVGDQKFLDYERLMYSVFQLTLVRGDGGRTVTREAGKIVRLHEEFFSEIGENEFPNAESARIYLKTESGKPQAQLSFPLSSLTAFFEFNTLGRKLQAEKRVHPKITGFDKYHY